MGECLLSRHEAHSSWDGFAAAPEEPGCSQWWRPPLGHRIEVNDDAADFASLGAEGVAMGLSEEPDAAARPRAGKARGGEAPRVSPCRTEQASSSLRAPHRGRWRNTPHR